MTSSTLDAPKHLTQYRPEIDGLRAVAVLAVVIYHAFPGALPGGFVGVDIFFVISGYLITSLLRAEWEAKGSLDIAAFYARRARRILPMLVTVVVCTLAAAAFLLDDRAAVQETASSATAALLFVANSYFQATTGGYFDPATERLPLLHLWSLGVEEQFYLVWPLALGLLLAKRPRRATPVVASAAIVSALLATAMCVVDPNAAFYLMPTRFWELAAGGLIALGASGSARRGPAFAWCGIALMIAAISLPTHGLAAVNVVLGTLGAALLVQAVHARGTLGLVGQVLQSKPAVFFGLISYSLYLWHWPLLAIARDMHPGRVPPSVIAALCTAAVGISWLSYRFIETPTRRPNPTTPNRRLVATSLLMCFSLALVSWSLANQDPPTQAPVRTLAEVTGNDLPMDPGRCRFTFKDNLDVFPKSGCERKTKSAAAVVIWGDSHAWALGPFAAVIAERAGLQLVSVTRDACPPALGYDINLARPVESAKCRQFNDLAIGQIKKSDTVIMAGNWLPYPDRASLLTALASTVAKASGGSQQVLLVGPGPILRDSVPRCIAAGDLDACGVRRAEFEAQAQQFTEGLKAIAQGLPNVTYVSRADFFCDSVNCPAMRDGYGLYWDANHVSATAARAFGLNYVTATVATTNSQ